jgi:hypothetical protein
MWARSAAFGSNAEPAVFIASIAWCEPTSIRDLLLQARQNADLVAFVKARNEAAVDSLQSVLKSEDPLEIAQVGTSLRHAISVVVECGVGIIGRPLFSGLLSMPWPASPVGILWRACELLREFRGESHVAAVMISGLTPVEANILTEVWLGMDLGSYTTTRGWPPETIATAADNLRRKGLMAGLELTDAGRALRKHLEDATDVQVAPIVSAISQEFSRCCTALERWSCMCIEAGAFPRDELKRAAG